MSANKTSLYLILSGLLGLSLIPLAYSQENSTAPLNQLILDTVKTMPSGGGYSAGNGATQALRHAVTTTQEDIFVEPSHAMPSYCSGATYLVFLKVIAALQNSRQLTLPPNILESLKPSGQPDGTGIWGRWNANGPGTARLFAELSLGPNFTDLSEALPGDFLKIFWSDNIGASEHGHSVIYLGTEKRDGIPYISYWSSNIPGGFGAKSVPLSRVHRMLFSRLEHPGTLARLATIPPSDHYLYSLQFRSSNLTEMERECGL